MNTLADNTSSFRSGTDISTLNGDIDTLLIDLWGTVARSDNREPIRDLQQILGYKVGSIDHSDVRSVDPEFLRICLTLDEEDPARFAQLVGDHFGLDVTPEMVAAFGKVIDEESMCSGIFFDAKKALKVLKQRDYRLALASNLWRFPVECLFEEDNLGKYFPEPLRVYSFRENVAKPEQSFFEKALVRVNTSAERCLMIGDHLENDILPARAAGIKTCLIDRNGKYKDDPRVPDDVIRIASMEELLDLLPNRSASQSEPFDQNI
ncbi:MAG: HAD family hydrolase [Cyanobacteria bacterium SZAS LIN-2]|nr:HAD family hydrolase [Cyanobacteria bacterium SZAS LIN-2]MBS2010987.1 HAD family hydrolase [Cyanobacteria bacterium SZAS TMP-1]